MIKGLNIQSQSHQFHSNRHHQINTITYDKKHRNTLISSLSLYQSIFNQYKHSNYYPFLSRNNSSYERDSKSVCDFQTQFSNSTSAIFVIRKESNETTSSTTQIYEGNYDDLIQQIIQARKESAIRISSFLKRKQTLIAMRRDQCIKAILNKRLKYIIKIQAAFRAFLVKSQIKVLASFDYILFYTLNDNSGELFLNKAQTQPQSHQAQVSITTISDKPHDKQELKLFIYGEHGKKKERQFIYSKLFKQFYIPFKKRGVLKQKYKVNFVLNGHIVVDSRYSIDNDTKGNFYNVLCKSILYKMGHNKREKGETLFYRKYMDLFKMKSYKKHSNSFDSLSISNASITNDQFNDCLLPQCSFDSSSKNMIKPILKKISDHIETFSKRRSTNVIHKVSFNQKVEYSY